jgi:hypothetical protein
VALVRVFFVSGQRFFLSTSKEGARFISYVVLEKPADALWPEPRRWPSSGDQQFHSPQEHPRLASTEEEQDMKNIIKDRVSFIAAIAVVGLIAGNRAAD